MSVFLRDISFYKRDLDPINQYVSQSAFYLSRLKNLPEEFIKESIIRDIKNKKLISAPELIVKFYERENYEDRSVKQASLSSYLRDINQQNLTIAPSLTCYVNAAERTSILAGFTDDNSKVRNIAKKEAAKQKAMGNIDQFKYFNNLQENRKLFNNSLSGAFSSGGSIVRNPSAHSSLTSTVRTMTSIGNASNERLISGNRHYRDPVITLNNIVVLAQHCDAKEIRETIAQYGLKFPTTDEVMDCIYFSTRLYWNDKNATLRIRNFVEKLTDEEKASVVYTGDLYHLRLLNQEVIKTFIGRMSKKVTDRVYEDPVTIIRDTNEMYVNYVHQICITEVEGINKDYSKLTKAQQDTVAGTCTHLCEVLDQYAGLIKTFFLTANMPCSVAYIRDSIRRTVVLSDTDSSMFSCDEWVYWYFGKLSFTEEVYGVSGAIMFMATQCIAHNLALYSANLNVEPKKLFTAAMKPEYVFPIFSLTSSGKHYFTYVKIKEGSVYSKLETEIKGVHLKSSAAPKPIVADSRKMMEAILSAPLNNEKISLRKWIKHVADFERQIKHSVLQGETTYLGRLNIKAADAYKESQEMSNYRHHLFWNEIFGSKYGSAPLPTYATIKFPSTLSNRKALKTWLEGIEDKEIVNRLALYFERTSRKDYNTFYVPQDIIEGYGVPIEIKQAIDIESLILEHMKSHRLILESIGFFAKEGLNLHQLGY